MALKVNLVIDQGTDFSTEFTINDEMDNPIDFSDYNIQSKFKKTFEANTSVSFTVNGHANGTITLGLDANSTINIEYGQYVWDLKAISPEPVVETTRLLEGLVQITPKVT